MSELRFNSRRWHGAREALSSRSLRGQCTMQISICATPTLKSSIARLMWSENSFRLSALRARRTCMAAESSFDADCSQSQSLASVAASPTVRCKRRARRLPSSILVCRPTSINNSAASLMASAATSQPWAMQLAGPMISIGRKSAPHRDHQVFCMPFSTRCRR